MEDSDVKSDMHAVRQQLSLRYGLTITLTAAERAEYTAVLSVHCGGSGEVWMWDLLWSEVFHVTHRSIDVEEEGPNHVAHIANQWFPTKILQQLRTPHQSVGQWGSQSVNGSVSQSVTRSVSHSVTQPISQAARSFK